MSTPGEPLSLIEHIMSFHRALTPDEMAEFLQMSRLTIIRKAKKQIIPSFRIGTCIRFDPKAIACWLKKRGVQ
jgi:excisionase family DNA binding protein